MSRIFLLLFLVGCARQEPFECRIKSNHNMKLMCAIRLSCSRPFWRSGYEHCVSTKVQRLKDLFE